MGNPARHPLFFAHPSYSGSRSTLVASPSVAFDDLGQLVPDALGEAVFLPVREVVERTIANELRDGSLGHQRQRNAGAVLDGFPSFTPRPGHYRNIVQVPQSEVVNSSLGTIKRRYRGGGHLVLVAVAGMPASGRSFNQRTLARMPRDAALVTIARL